MKLSMSMLGQYLKRHAPECRIQEKVAAITGVRFFSEHHTASSLQYVYIGPAAAYFQDPRYANALLLANGKSQILCSSADYEELLNDVLSAFEFYNGIEQRLAALAARHGNLAEMMSVIAEALPAPFFVFSLDGALLASVHAEALSQSNSRLIFNGSSMRLSAIGDTFIDSNGQIIHDLTTTPQSCHVADSGEVAVDMYFQQQGEIIGFLMCFPSSPLEEALALCLEAVFAEYIKEASEFTDASSVHQSVHSVLLQLIQGVALPREVIKKLAQVLGSPAQLSLIAFRNLSIQNYTIRKIFMTEVEDALPCLTCEHGETVVILTGAEHAAGVIDLIGQRLPTENIALGVSLPMQSLDSLPVAWRQAVFALDAAPGPGIRYCRELALPYLLQALKKEPRALDLLHPAIGALRGYDRENNGELSATLRAYILSGCAQAKTAETLHVHLNTLKYRLRRIAELTGVDFNDQDEVFYLRLSLALDE